MKFSLLVIVIMIVGSVEGNLNNGSRIVCFYLKGEEGTCVPAEIKRCCTDSLTSIIETLNENSLVSNTSHIVIEIKASLPLMDTIVFENFQESEALEIDGQWNKLSCKNHNNSGLYFRAVKNLLIRNLTLDFCGTLQESTSEDINTDNSTVKFKSSIYILNCTNVSLNELNIVNSNGKGATFFDTIGTVLVRDSMFKGNMVYVNGDNPYPGGGGVYVEFTYCTPGIYKSCTNRSEQDKVTTEYSFHNCEFSNNIAEMLQPSKTSYVLGAQSNFQGFGRGGGLAIIFKGYHSGISISIHDCKFTNNTAYWGGGLYVVFRDKTNDNRVTIERTAFVQNYAKVNGGGGARIGFLSYSLIDSFSDVMDNNVTLINCTFESNRADQYGGGTSVVASKDFHSDNNRVEFIACRWENNEALTASAVDLSPGVWSVLGNGILPMPAFTDCTFKQNQIRSVKTKLGPGITQERRGAGTFLATCFSLTFIGTTEFINNTGTALYLTSAVVNFEQNSNVVFRENTGQYGGAIAMIAFSVLFLNADTSVTFDSNSAERRGGAIYTFSVEKHETSRSCFIQCKGGAIPKEELNITINFINNRAVSGMGHTLYTTSLSPCLRYCATRGIQLNTAEILHQGHSNYTNIFDCVGHSYITHSPSTGFNIVTHKGNVEYTESDLDLNSSQTLYEVIPGKDFPFPVMAVDELEQSQPRAYDIVFKPFTNNLSQSVLTHRTSSSKINLVGVTGLVDLGTLVYEDYDFSVSINITILNCPPGYALNEDKGECYCVQAHYKGLFRCDNSKMQAFILHGFWIGWCGHDHHELCTAHCPMGFCSYNGLDDSANEYLLPSSADDLEMNICGVTRKGTLCAKCNDNYSVYFHSKLYKCGETTHCKYGIPLYIASELLPLTVIFMFIIAFDIRFTSGYLNGFIFYAQVLDSLVVTARGAIRFTPEARVLTAVYQFIYRPLNLDFFDSFEQLSFCIWKGATVMDVLAMKYATILYALLLVVTTVLLWNTRLCAKLTNHACCHRRTLKNAVIHGLSAFFVMCYSQCVKVSFQILGFAILYGYDYQPLDVVVFNAGDQKPFRGRHLLYSIPAVTFLTTLVAIPPILLLAYPLIFKLLSKCNLSESKPIVLLSRLIPMQLLDSFQSCFKDKYRFFAGLYFLYRILILATSTVLPTLFYAYIAIEVELVLILTVHSVIQPYKVDRHNKIDSMLFANLAIINGLSLLNYHILTQRYDDGGYVTGKILRASTYVQLILICLPLICLVFYVTNKLAHYTINTCKELSLFNRDRSWETVNSTELPSLREAYDNRKALAKDINYRALTNKIGAATQFSVRGRKF